MAEYSRLAQGSFTFNGSAPGSQVVYLPFVPDKVEVWDLTGINHPANSYNAYALWNSFMAQGDASGWRTTVFGTTPAVTALAAVNYSPGGITTFSAGLSFSFGAQEAIASITKANPAVVTTVSAHGYATGDIVLFEGISGMQQIAGIPFAITVTGTTTFTIPWNTNQSSYTAISGSPSGTYVKKVNYPFLYAPGVSIISAIGLGTSTTVTTTTPHNLVVGQQVAFRIPPAANGGNVWGTMQLNSLPNTQGIPGSPMYGYVTTVNSNVQVTVNINSTLFTPYTNNMPTTQVPGLSFPQILAVGDVNNGGVPYSGSSLYPSPVVNGVSTINGPAIQGAFVNNTRMGFVIGSGIITQTAQSFYWEASLHDYSNGIAFAAIP